MVLGEDIALIYITIYLQIIFYPLFHYNIDALNGTWPHWLQTIFEHWENLPKPLP